MNIFSRIKPIINQFAISGEAIAAQSLTTGHINDTYEVDFLADNQITKYILQRINHQVFPEPEKLMANCVAVTQHLRKKLVADPGSLPQRETLEFIPTEDPGDFFFLDQARNYWRMYHYIDDTHTIDYVNNLNQSYQVARTFAKFAKLLADLPTAQLHETIPFFHHTPKRYSDLTRAIEDDSCNRAANATEEISFARQQEAVTAIIIDGLANGSIPERVTHNDTKINNVLIDNTTGKGVCVIDLDTVMPGSLLYDFGDMVRTSTCFAAEDERDLAKVHMDMDMYKTLLRGYLEELSDTLTFREIELLPFAGKLITYTIGIRFLTDYLQGDVYFKTHRPEQNRDRARVQFALIESMEEQEDKMNQTIDEFL